MAHQSIPMCKQSKANTNIKDLFLGGIAQLILDVKTIREYLVPKVRLTRKKWSLEGKFDLKKDIRYRKKEII